MADLQYITTQDEAPESSGPKPPLDFSYHFSRVTAARQASSIKKFYKYFAIPGIGNLAGGLPHASFFPYDTLEAQIAKPERFKPTPNDPNQLSEKLASTSINKAKPSDASHLVIPHASSVQDPAQKIDLTTALQYGTAQGYPPLYSFLRQLTRDTLHPNIPYLGGADIVLSIGNTDGFAKTVEALSNVWSAERDWVGEREGILVEEFAYMNAVQTVRPRGLQVVPVKMDAQGMLASGAGGLKDVLENWDTSKGKRPHLMYTITIGQNPSGGTLSLQRRKDLYALCSKYDVMIIEDDPYWYLQYPSAAELEAEARGEAPAEAPSASTFSKSTGFPFLDSLVPSSLNIDTDGRVIRLDTFSKTVAPGCRLGWITAQPAIIERITRITETSTQQPSGFVQSMIAELMMGPQPIAAAAFAKKSRSEQMTFSGWEVAGWIRWLEGLRGMYERRMTRMCSALEDGRFQLKQGTPVKSAESDWAVISKTEMYSFQWPRGGMFIWVRVHYESHPLWGQVDPAKLAQGLWIYLTMKPFLVLVAPGQTFCPTPEIVAEEGWKYYRLCFAAVTEEDVAATGVRFAEAVQGFWKIKDVDDLPFEDEETVDDVSEGVVDLGLHYAC